MAALRRLWPVVVVVGAGVLVYYYGFLRTAIAVLMFAAIVSLGTRHLTRVSTIPPEAEPTDVRAHDLRYICTMCGLELKVEVAARDKAPTHCMEPMVLVDGGGKPPLRSV